MVSIRDYIYFDIERVRSVYAQLSEGLIYNIIKSEETQEALDKSESQGAINKSEITKSLYLGLGRVETQTLHDYLFTEVEQKLGEYLTDVSIANIDELQPGGLIRVTGKAELDDTERLLSIANNYNQFYGSLLLVGEAQAIQEKVWHLQDQLADLSDNNRDKERKRNIQKELESLTVEALSRRLKLGIPEITKTTLEGFLNLLYPGVFEIKILAEQAENAVFRAIINRDYLRESSTLIYAKYGSRTQVNWTMVGMLTTILDPKYLGEESDIVPKVNDYLQQQGLNVSAKKIETVTNDSKQEDIQNTSNNQQNIRDVIENLYDSLFNIEKFMTTSATEKVWVISPLAIYHQAE
jgi:hypothetical protein